jgi:cell division protein FtsB
MLQAEVEQTMRSVAEHIQTVTDLQASKVCHLLADLLRKALEENVRLRAQIEAQAAEIAALKVEVAQLRAENAILKEHSSTKCWRASGRPGMQTGRLTRVARPFLPTSNARARRSSSAAFSTTTF